MGKFKKYVQMICEGLELIASVLVLIGILLSVYSLVKDFEIFGELLNDISTFRHYLEQVFSLVIGIEFLQMLCRPNSDNVIEVLIFLVARHMIVGDTTPYQDFVSVISVALLCVLRRYLRISQEDRDRKWKTVENKEADGKREIYGQKLQQLSGKTDGCTEHKAVQE